jgi:hypothetical protein
MKNIQIEEITKNVIEHICNLPDDSIITIRDAFDELYLKDGYEWIYKNSHGGWICSKDKGRTWLIKEQDLLKIYKSLAGTHGVVLDFSEYDNPAAELGYNIPFVLRRGSS